VDLRPGIDAGAESPYVSTGELPSAELVQRLVDEAYERYATNDDGERSQVYPALGAVPAGLFGICMAGISGEIQAADDATTEFTIMSVAKPFLYALVCRELGRDELRQLVGVNATGLPFNSLAAVERSADCRTNPMVSPGAIAVTSLVPGVDADEKWSFIRDGLSGFAGRALEVDDEVYRSASETNHRNQSLARLLQSYGRLYSDPAEAVDLYTRQSCLEVTARDLAAMGATLANGGTNPLTHERVVDAESCHCTLAVMTTAGLYETSGDWLYDIGLPGKSGIGGGIVTVAPGKGGLGTFAPSLDSAGNSVRGQLAAAFLSRRLGPDPSPRNPKDERPHAAVLLSAGSGRTTTGRWELVATSAAADPNMAACSPDCPRAATTRSRPPSRSATSSSTTHGRPDSTKPVAAPSTALTASSTIPCACRARASGWPVRGGTVVRAPGYDTTAPRSGSAWTTSRRNPIRPARSAPRRAAATACSEPSTPQTMLPSRSPAPRSRRPGGTTTTGQRALVASDRDTLPKTAEWIAPRPREPTTRRSAPSSSTEVSKRSWGDPSTSRTSSRAPRLSRTRIAVTTSSASAIGSSATWTSTSRDPRTFANQRAVWATDPAASE
jgi:glutaminase